MQIRLDKDVEDRLIAAAGKSGRSASELANMVLRTVDVTELQESIKVAVKTSEGRKTYRQPRRFVVDW